MNPLKKWTLYVTDSKEVICSKCAGNRTGAEVTLETWKDLGGPMRCDEGCIKLCNSICTGCGQGALDGVCIMPDCPSNATVAV